MSKTLIIAEKPSVATDIQKVLGGMQRVKTDAGDYFEGEQYVVASAVGHLLELAVPEKYDVKRGKWTFAHLPLIPPEFTLKPIAKSEGKLKLLAKLIRRKDIGCLINACDAGREGELIFRYIVQATKAKQPIKRLWLQSMTPASIRSAFANLRSDEEMQPLAAAARSRSEADWLVGINGTRAMTAFNSKNGGFFLTTVGRVQTPTLAVVVSREAEIRAFRPRDYWQVEAAFGAKAGEYAGTWFDPAFKKESAGGDDRADRIWDEKKADTIRAKCEGKTGVVTETKKRVKHAAPPLFDLTTLQREANNRFGFTAKTTLALAQALYEKHKVLSYPRTDAKCLPTDYVETAKKTLSLLTKLPQFSTLAENPVAGGWVKPNPRIFNTEKISDHFALVPLPDHLPTKLSEPEAKIYDLVARRFIAVFYPACEVDETTRVAEVEGESFRTRGNVMAKPGWREVYGTSAGAMGSGALVPVAEGERVEVLGAESVKKTTLPPPRYTEATLLSAMEGAGRMVEDSELRSAMQEKGIGTPATRAAIIEGLIVQKYLLREGRELRPTSKAFELLSLLKGLKVEALSEPSLTGEWENRLAQIERGTLSREEFMAGIRGMTEKIVEAARHYEGDSVPIENPVHLKHRCPKCGGEIVENFRRYACTNEGCDFSITKHPAGRTFEPEELEELLEKKTIGPLQGFVSKMGRPFAAALRLTPAPDYKLEFVFDDGPKESEEEPTDFTGLEPICKCPVCGGRVFELPMAYVCENTKKRGDGHCAFRMGKVILQQPVERAQFDKLIATGKTDLLKGFVSNRTHRKFSAYLKLEKDGKVGFEFEEREPRAAAAAKKAPARKTTAKAKAAK